MHISIYIRAILVTALLVVPGNLLAQGTFSRLLSEKGKTKTSPAYVKLEQTALQNWQSGKNDLAINQTLQLVRAFKNKQQEVAFGQRSLSMLKSLFNKTREFSLYDRTLLDFKRRFAANAAFINDVNAHQRQLMQRLVGLGKQPGLTANKRQNIIATLTRYANILDDESMKKDVQKDIAALYHLNKNYPKAVSMYLTLAEAESTPAPKQTFYQLAAGSQSLLAGWTFSPPWQNYVVKSKVDERIKLQQVYTALNESYSADNKTSWRVNAQLGLLHLSLGNSSAAFELWTKQLGAKNISNDPDAARAAGLMLFTYEQRKAWQNLQDLARQCLQNNIRPIYRDRPYNLSQAYALALLWGGRAQLDQQNYGAAVKDLKEFISSYRQHALRPDGLYFLAFAHRGAGDHTQSLSVINELIDSYPQSKYTAQALLNAGEWAMAMAMEEQLIAYYELYLKRFPATKDAPKVRETLWEIYIGRGFYAQAAEQLRAHMNASQVAMDERLAAAAILLDLEEKHGSPDRALGVCQILLAWSAADSELKASALAVKARYAHSKGNAAELAQIESHIIALAGNGENSQEALSETRYYAAALIAAQVARTEIFNLELTNPLGTINTEYSKYVDAKTRFEGACQVNSTSYCIPALYEISKTADRLLERIQNVEIPKSMSGTVVGRFQKRKNAVADTLAKHVESYMDKALSLTAEGNAFPDTVKQVLWETSVDWTFESIVGETGAGHLGFRPSSFEVNNHE